MIWITLNTLALLGIAAVLVARIGRKHDDTPARSAQPPQVFSNLPQVDRVDIRAMLAKWDD
jgi:hypothetical protein